MNASFMHVCVCAYSEMVEEDTEIQVKVFQKRFCIGEIIISILPFKVRISCSHSRASIHLITTPTRQQQQQQQQQQQ